jgi:predicted ATPase/class 3 adenylate cyclase
MMACQACGHDNSNDAASCEACGRPLRDAARQVIAPRGVELRQATVVFCDLVGSARLPYELDAAALVEFYDRYYNLVSQAAHLEHGHVNRMQGDGAMLLFGYPATREDAAECGLRAALDLVSSLPARLGHPSRTLSLRVGVATGTVVFAGETNQAANRETSLLGPVPERAARLQTLAEPGQVLTDATTRRLGGAFFSYRDLGPQALKNIDQPVPVWEVTAATGVSSRFAAQHRAPGQIVGRDEPLARLAEAWQAARAGRGRVALISGEAGIGKSVMARQTQGNAAADGAFIASLDCSARMTNAPLHAVTSWLRSFTGIALDDDSATQAVKAHTAIAALVGQARADTMMRYVALALGPAVVPQGESADMARERLIGGLVDVVVALASRQPLCIVLEDAQWADATTLAWLERLVTACASLPVLLLVTTRPDVDLSARLPDALYVALQRLTPTAARQLVEQALPEAPAQQVDELVARGDGVPLFLEELTRNVSQGTGARSATGGMVESTVPWVMQVVVQGRLDRWTSLRPVVHAAATLGREFSLPLLARLLDLPEAALAETLAQLTEIGILAEAAPGSSGLLTFGHALIHEAVYDSMMRTQRAPLHARAADLLLEAQAQGSSVAMDTLIHHLGGAERFELAVACCIGAAVATAGRAAYGESRGHCMTGLGWVDRIADAGQQRLARLQLLVLFGTACAATDGYAAPQVEKAYHEARLLCDTAGDPAALFPVVRGLGFYYFVRAQLDTADQLARQCLLMARRSGRPDYRIEALSFRGYTDIYIGRIARGRRCLELAIQRQRRQPGLPSSYTAGQHPVTAALALKGNLAWAQGDAALAETAAQEAVAFARALARPFDEAYVLGWVAGLRNLQRRWNEAQRFAKECVDVSERYGFDIWQKTGLAQAGVAAALQSPSPATVQSLYAALQRFTGTGAEINSAYFMWGLARSLRLLGDLATARGLTRQALDCAMRTDGLYIYGELLLLDAEMEPDPEAARTLVRQALHSGQTGGGVTLALRAALRLLQLHGLRTEDVVGPDVEGALDGTADFPARADWIPRALTEALKALRTAGAVPA